MSLVRLSPQVQRLQANSPYIDIYTNASTSPLRSHPEPKRWENAGDWGARHINDKAPFNLWDEKNRKYRMPKGNELRWLRHTFGGGQVGSRVGTYLWIETANPPQPDSWLYASLVYRSRRTTLRTHPGVPYPNPRVPDPCPGLQWPILTFPSRSKTPPS